MAALASLTANYTDSEDEDHEQKENPLLEKLKESTPQSGISSQSQTPTKKTKLVSYIDPDDMDAGSDEGGSPATADEDTAPVPMDLDSTEDEGSQMNANKENSPSEEMLNTSAIEVECWNEGVKLPPEPPGECDEKLQSKVTKLYERKLRENYDMNYVIQSKKGFRNPSIYEKLIQYCGIDEHGTNFPKELYDGHLFGRESYYDELAKVQKTEMERREKAAKDRAHKSASSIMSGASAAPSSAGADAPKRKSKWDQVGQGREGGSATTTNPIAKSAPVAPPQIVSAGAPSVTKSIPAFGSLKKH